MTRKLKHHEQKLLRKVDFNTYKSDNDHRETLVMRRYAIQGRDDYRKYNQLCGSLRQLAHKIANLDPADPFRRKQEDMLLEKLFDMGILGTGGGGRGKLSDIEHKVTVSAFARRRLPVVMTRLRMSEHLTSAIKMIEQGHVRVGTTVITDPAYLVTRQVLVVSDTNYEQYTNMLCFRNMEDFVTWVDSSKIKRNIMKYRDKLDDFELEAL
ncbi:Small subunit (SSU) processome component [Curvularia kusanoi]|uniref:Small subunit (SSU) processome component n=1 Tax=Curvularia kusanoi TaxID=90978 RepID=A0A9P4WEJ7_CURKU|nr:Small subunit (SSU) processome component [Curvularia kusanoi]